MTGSIEWRRRLDEGNPELKKIQTPDMVLSRSHDRAIAMGPFIPEHADADRHRRHLVKTIPTDSIKLGRCTEHPAAAGIPLDQSASRSEWAPWKAPSFFIQGGTLMLVAAGVIWSAAEPARQERNRSLAYWKGGRFYWSGTGVLPMSLLNSTDLQPPPSIHGRHWPFDGSLRSRSPSGTASGIWLLCL